MEKLVFKIAMTLDKEELDILMKALNFFTISGTMFDYPDEVEICKDVQRKIKRNLSTKYLEDYKSN